ncbi:hypothetical protein [Rhodanobacter thiooxydans]|uniref:hypothetical protein n=1 Tax=Rhodanobacter thiooxydans TaxID=416169 RepID=UPI00131ED8FE|nr:hypothetical protein [Rhodanobacter thiooxydans]
MLAPGNGLLKEELANMNLNKSPDPGMTQDNRQSRARVIKLFLSIVASLLYVSVRMHTPIAVHAEAVHDDQLFISMGERIADGHWLGSYDQLTLIKGPGYPLFLAINAWLGIPISLSEVLFHGFTVGLFFWVFARLTRMPNVAMFGYIATLWMPASPYLERIVRDSIYPGQMLLVLAGMMATLYLDISRKRQYTWALLTGLALGWFSLTREEGIWIGPGLAVIVLASILYRHDKQRIKTLVLAPVAVIIAGYGVTQVVFSCINRIAYGSFVGVEVSSSPFKEAMSALQSVQAGEQIPYVPVSKQAREAIYQVSPSFLKLKGYLDPPTGSSWQFGCQIYPKTCGDIAGGWFMWALRGAVAINGYYGSPKRAANFYRQLTNEVEDACKAGKLRCKPLPVSMLPRIAASQWEKFPATLLLGLRMVTFDIPLPVVNPPSSGPAANLMADVRFLGSPLRTAGSSDTSTYSISGWYYGRDKKGWISGKISSGGQVNISLPARDDSPDLVTGLGDPAALHQRFNIAVNCQEPCIYRFADEEGSFVDIPLAEEAVHPSSHPLNGATLHIDQIGKSSMPSVNDDRRYRFRIGWQGMTEWAYGHVLPWLLPLSLLAMLLTLAISLIRRSLTPTVALATALWSLLASRLVLLTLVDISAFPGIRPDYLSTAYVLACIVPILSFVALYELVFASRSQSSSIVPRPEVAHV